MSRQATKQNNDPRYLDAKIALRLQSLPDKDVINILDAYGGEGVLWSTIKNLTNKKINVLSIDVNKYNHINLQGDNLKFLQSIDLNKFDIIDLDAWGSPVEQLLILQKKHYNGIVHCTFIQTEFGKLSNKLLTKIGYPKSMISKCPTLFSKNGIEKMLLFVHILFNINYIYICSFNRKNYFYFCINRK
jgi:hypothetical protein